MNGTCKAANAACTLASTCKSGVCQNNANASQTCGGVGGNCCQSLGGEFCTAGGTVCDNGKCQTCGGPGQPCCGGDTCNGGGCCNSDTRLCIGSGSTCPAGLGGGTCSNGGCNTGACGKIGEACCAGDLCTSGFSRCAGNNVCVPCGGLNERCCAGDFCGAPYGCNQNNRCTL